MNEILCSFIRVAYSNYTANPHSYALYLKGKLCSQIDVSILRWKSGGQSACLGSLSGDLEEVLRDGTKGS